MISLIAKRQPARRATKVDPVEQAPEFAVGFPKLRDAAQSQASGALRSSGAIPRWTFSSTSNAR